MTDNPTNQVAKIMAIIYTQHPDDRFLALKLHREPSKKTGWFVVTGAVEKSETHVQALRREVFEETGLANIKAVHDLNISYQYPLDDGSIALERAFAVEVPMASKIVLNEEHTDWAWCESADFINRLAWDGDKADLRAIVERILAQY